jgi:hypothetical protein
MGTLHPALQWALWGTLLHGSLRPAEQTLLQREQILRLPRIFSPKTKGYQVKCTFTRHLHVKNDIGVFKPQKALACNATGCGLQGIKHHGAFMCLCRSTHTLKCTGKQWNAAEVRFRVRHTE